MPNDNPIAGLIPSVAIKKTWPPSKTPMFDGMKMKRVLIITVREVIRNAMEKLNEGSNVRRMTYVSHAPSIHPRLWKNKTIVNLNL